MGFADQGSSALRNNRRLSKIGERKFHNKKFVLMGNDQPEKKAVDPVRSAEKIRAIRFWAKVQNVMVLLFVLALFFGTTVFCYLFG